MTLSPKLGVGISILWHFRLPLPIQMFIKVASSPRLSGIGMPSPILWYHPLKMQRIVLLSSLLWWELGTNSLITGPGEWLSFRRFTSKPSWSWYSPEHARMKLTHFIYPQLTIRWQIKHFTVIYGAGITIFDTKIEYFLPRKNLPIWDPNLATWKPKAPYLSPRKYHIYVYLSIIVSCRSFETLSRASVPPTQILWTFSFNWDDDK